MWMPLYVSKRGQFLKGPRIRFGKLDLVYENLHRIDRLRTIDMNKGIIPYRKYRRHIIAYTFELRMINDPNYLVWNCGLEQSIVLKVLRKKHLITFSCAIHHLKIPSAML